MRPPVSPPALPLASLPLCEILELLTKYPAGRLPMEVLKVEDALRAGKKVSNMAARDHIPGVTRSQTNQLGPYLAEWNNESCPVECFQVVRSSW